VQGVNIEGLVMRSVQTGRDLGQLMKDLQEQFGVTRRRAAFVARDQNNKATASMTRARQHEPGITQAIWVHSGAGKHPRPTSSSDHCVLASSTSSLSEVRGWIMKFMQASSVARVFRIASRRKFGPGLPRHRVHRIRTCLREVFDAASLEPASREPSPYSPSG
jgi:hypothetical protein